MGPGLSYGPDHTSVIGVTVWAEIRSGQPFPRKPLTAAISRLKLGQPSPRMDSLPSHRPTLAPTPEHTSVWCRLVLVWYFVIWTQPYRFTAPSTREALRALGFRAERLGGSEPLRSSLERWNAVCARLRVWMWWVAVSLADVLRPLHALPELLSLASPVGLACTRSKASYFPGNFIVIARKTGKQHVVIHALIKEFRWKFGHLTNSSMADHKHLISQPLYTIYAFLHLMY